MKRVLSIDLGGGSGRGIVFSINGGRFEATEVHRFPNAPISENGTLRWNLRYLFEEVKNALKATEERGLPVESLSVDTWGVDYAFVMKNGEITQNPYCYRDARTEGMTESFPPMGNRELFDLAGISLTSFNTSYQLYAEAQSRDFCDVDKLLFMPNAIGYLLTGVAATEPCIASTSAFYTRENGFSKEFAERIGVPFRIFPEVRPTGSVLGDVKTEILSELGIAHRVTVVLGAGHDTACAVMSVPSAEKNPLFLSSGTWSLFGTELDAPIVNDLSFSENYTNELGYGGSVRFLKNIMGFWLLQESKKKWNETEDISVDEIVALSKTAPAFRGIVDVGDPVFNPPGDMPRRICGFASERTGVRLNGIAEIARAMFESLALEYRYALNGLRKITNKDYKALYVVGGGSRNDFMNGMIADCLEVEVYAGPAEATAIGNAVCQFLSNGELSSLSAARKMIRDTEKIKVYSPSRDRGAWDEAYERYLKLKSIKI